MRGGGVVPPKDLKCLAGIDYTVGSFLTPAGFGERFSLKSLSQVRLSEEHTEV